MKIAILAHSLFPIAEPFAGGLEMIIHLQVKELQQMGHDVSLYAHPDSDPIFNIMPVCISEVDQQSCDVTVNPSITYAYLNAIDRIAKENYDIIHSHVLNGDALQRLSQLDIPVVHSLHTPVIDALVDGVIAASHCANVTFTAVSKHLADLWQNELDIAVDVVHNGIELNQWTYTENPLANQVMWCGRFCPEKAPDQAIKAAVIADCKLVMAGPIYDQKYFDNVIVRLLEYDNVHYLGHLKQQELNFHLGNSEALLFTSIWDEPFGLVMAESLACGTPVLAYDSGAASEIIGSEAGRIIPKGSIHQLAWSMPSMGKLNRAACRQVAESKWDHKVMTEKYLTTYQKTQTRKLKSA